GNVSVAQNVPINEIKVEFKSSERVSVEAIVDGAAKTNVTISPDSPKTYTAQQSLKLKYYKGFADKVQITVNGKQITPPPPAKGNIIEVEITKDNIAQILQSGSFAPVSTASPNPAAATTPAPVRTPRATPRATAAPTPVPSATQPVNTKANTKPAGNVNIRQ
ncbi:MAG: hypothetical protein ACR2GD_04505, partial [Pyrinomonadaceae bacterium]